ncbi:AI-2E family transporter [Acidisoma sp. C75]
MGRVLLGLAGLTLLLLCIWLLHDELLLIFLAVLLAASLRGAADRIARHTPLGPRAAMAIILCLVAAASIGFCIWVGPRLIQQGIDLARALAQEGQNLAHRYGNTSWGREVLQKLNASAGASAQSLAMPVLNIASVTFGAVAGFFVLVVTIVYFASSPHLYLKGLTALLPPARRPRALEVLAKVGHVLRWWFLGQLIAMLVVGVFTVIGLAIIGMPMALALGVMAGLLTFVPYFGAILAAIPALAIALGQGLHMALLTLIVFTVGHVIEGYIVSPLVQDRMVRLPPALLILSMTALGTLFGPLGIILATPLAASGLVLVSELYVVDVLKDESGRDITTRAISKEP